MENQDKYLEQLRIFSFDSLCNLENHCWEAEDYFSFNLSMLADPVPAIGKFDLLKLIHKIKKEYLKIHIKPEDFVEIIRDEMNYSDQRLHYAHLVYCEECFDKFKEYRLACSVFIDKKLEDLVNSVNSKNTNPEPTESSKAEANDSNDDESESEDDLDNSNDDEPEAKEELINSVNSKNSNPAPAESSKADPDDPNEVQSEAKAEEKPEIPVTEPVKTNTIAVKKYLIYAIIFVIPLLVISMLWLGNRYGIKSQNEQIALLDKAHREENPVQLAYLFEEISKKIESDRTKAILYSARAVVAEKLLLIERSEQDREQYYKLTGERIELVQKQKVYEPDVYDELETLIDSYLLARSSGNSNLAVTHLNNAKKLANNIAIKGDRIGVDLVQFYSNLSNNKVKKLLKLRRKKAKLTNVAAIDDFQETIDSLKELEELFIEENAQQDVEAVVCLLVKFLVKTGKYIETREIIEKYLPDAQKLSHKLVEAKLTFFKGEINLFKNEYILATKFHAESLEILKTLPPNPFKLYPLHVILSRQVGVGGSESIFLQGLDGLKMSMDRSENSAFYGAFVSTLAQFHALNAKNLGMKNLTREYLELSIEYGKKYKSSMYARESICLLAIFEVKEGHIEEGFSLLQETKNYYSIDPLAKVIDEMLETGYRAKLFGMTKDYVKAEEYYRKALSLAEELKIVYSSQKSYIEQGLAEALWLQGKNDEAQKYLEQAIKTLEVARSQQQIIQKYDELQRVNFTDYTIDQIMFLIKR
ncbi:MAG: tetratricopeptide repeat protein [Blastocatellia bacterium]|nr:tetratricopeptide repeat protein [Blastocatellia bacterium]